MLNYNNLNMISIKIRLTSNYNVQNYQPYNELGPYEFDDLTGAQLPGSPMWIRMGPYDLNGEYNGGTYKVMFFDMSATW